MAITALPRTRQGVFHAVGAARQYPVLPIAVLLLVLVFPGIFAEGVAPHDPIAGSLPDRLTPPAWVEGGSWDRPLGTDNVGRDVLSRIIHGARVSLSVALVSIAVGATVGISLGLISGYFGGNIDHLIMRIVDIKLAFPSILLALVLATVLRPGFFSVVLIIALVLWTSYARMVRGETLRVREMDYVARARVVGASNLRIMVRHVLPNTVNSIIVLATLEVGSVILFEASLSFLGIGIPPPSPSWGLMVADGRVLVMTAWWVSFFPGLAILLTVLSMNLFGDWLRDKLDPKLRNI
jgi:peptide/nickel transport system permease protein